MGLAFGGVVSGSANEAKLKSRWLPAGEKGNVTEEYAIWRRNPRRELGLLNGFCILSLPIANRPLFDRGIYFDGAART